MPGIQQLSRVAADGNTCSTASCCCIYTRAKCGSRYCCRSWGVEATPATWAARRHCSYARCCQLPVWREWLPQLHDRPHTRTPRPSIALDNSCWPLYAEGWSSCCRVHSCPFGRNCITRAVCRPATGGGGLCLRLRLNCRCGCGSRLNVTGTCSPASGCGCSISNTSGSSWCSWTWLQAK